MIFNMTGGGVSVMCDVVGGLSAPTGLKANTIWVKTNIPILRTLIQPTTPTGDGNTVVGTVWVQDNASTWLNPNFNFTNSPKILMRCFPGKVYQHDGSRWVKKEAYIQQGGRLVQISSEFTAEITVNCPDGSTVTCANGATTLTGKSAKGKCTFTVRKSGTWTVTASLDGKSTSGSVSITSDEQQASVTLSYRVYLYRAGDLCEAVSGGWDGVKCGSAYASSGTHRFDSDGMVITLASWSCWGVHTQKKVDVSGYTKLVAEFDGANICKNEYATRTFHAELLDDLAAGDWNFKNRPAHKNTTDGTQRSLTVDISRVAGDKHVALEYGTNSHSDETGVKVTAVYLE